MKQAYRPRGATQISDVANRLIDPVLTRRAGINTLLLGSWDEIAGADFADCTRPEQIAWPARGMNARDGEGHRPGVLTIACEGSRALFLSHAQGELMQRINGFFGFPAIGRIRIVQKPVVADSRRPRRAPVLNGPAAVRLDAMVGEVEDERLRAALTRLGTAVLAQAGKKRAPS
ncbi:DUF721 domain-containing protein [Ensifer soli]|uniref:DUF721 domain-containing protein n=1 Tax=Ciceribacter sp. sgz301302 TaxID=3342379 RepID=UPI0035B6FFAF